MYDIIITILLTLILLSLVIFFIVLSNSSKIGKIEKNKVHFYVARDKDGKLWLYLNKPIRTKIFGYIVNTVLLYVLTRYLKISD